MSQHCDEILLSPISYFDGFDLDQTLVELNDISIQSLNSTRDSEITFPDKTNKRKHDSADDIIQLNCEQNICSL